MPDTNPAQQANPGIPDVADPLLLFQEWMAEAQRSEPNDANAMALATCTPDGLPSARMVLLKGADERGFVFYTNARAARAGNCPPIPMPRCCFTGRACGRQVRIEGAVGDVADAEADAYFASRARVSRLGALASDQSRPLPARAELERRVAGADARYPGDSVPRPPHWSGFRVVPRVDRVLAGHAVPAARPAAIRPRRGWLGPQEPVSVKR